MLPWGSRTSAMRTGSSSTSPAAACSHCWSTCSWASLPAARNWSGRQANSVQMSLNSSIPSRLRRTVLSISAMQVLLVEDDEGVASALAELLDQAGASVVRTSRGADALHRVKGCDLVLLDLGLPDMDGLDVLRTLRRASAVPVIIMTARDSDGAVVLGLRAGADDYLVKPVRKAVLLARIDAVMRRLRRVTGDTSTPAGPVTIDRERREVALEGSPQALTRTEFQLLSTLAARQGEAVSREELMLEVWGTAVVGRSRSLDFFIGQIRAKLPGLPLQTVRGFGFRLDPCHGVTSPGRPGDPLPSCSG